MVVFVSDFDMVFLWLRVSPDATAPHGYFGRRPVYTRQVLRGEHATNSLARIAIRSARNATTTGNNEFSPVSQPPPRPDRTQARRA
jgi:hypothetical protein